MRSGGGHENDATLARILSKRNRLKQRYVRQINKLEQVPYAQTEPFEPDLL